MFSFLLDSHKIGGKFIGRGDRGSGDFGCWKEERLSVKGNLEGTVLGAISCRYVDY
jgi:hypothetical protein